MCRDSIIPVTTSGGGEGDYNNVGLCLLAGDRERLVTVTGREEVLYTDPNKVVAALDLEVTSQKKRVSKSFMLIRFFNLAHYNMQCMLCILDLTLCISIPHGRSRNDCYNACTHMDNTPEHCTLTSVYSAHCTHTHVQSSEGYYNLATPGSKVSVVPLPRLGGVVPPSLPAAVDDEDYMNEAPEGIFHTYSNQRELLEQVVYSAVHNYTYNMLYILHFLACKLLAVNLQGITQTFSSVAKSLSLPYTRR